MPKTRTVLDLTTLVTVHRLLSGDGIQHLIYGGWGLDIACGRQSRPHGDLDLLCWRRHYPRLRSLLSSHGITGYELPGRHVAVQTPFRADIVFLEEPETGWIVGTASVFEVRLPRRALRDWAYGTVGGHRLPVGSVELLVRLSGHSPKSHPSDRRLVDAITTRCDQRLLAEIRHQSLPYDRSVAWRPFPASPGPSGPRPRSPATGQ